MGRALKAIHHMDNSLPILSRKFVYGRNPALVKEKRVLTHKASYLPVLTENEKQIVERVRV